MMRPRSTAMTGNSRRKVRKSRSLCTAGPGQARVSPFLIFSKPGRTGIFSQGSASGLQWFPEERYAILSADGKEEGFCGFYLWDHYEIFRKRARRDGRSWARRLFAGMHTTLVEYGAEWGCLSMCCGCRDGCEVWTGLMVLHLLRLL